MHVVDITRYKAKGNFSFWDKKVGFLTISYPESSGSLASGWSPGKILEYLKKNLNFWIGRPVMACIVLPQGSCGNKINSSSPESLLTTNRWPKNPRTLDARLGISIGFF